MLCWIYSMEGTNRWSERRRLEQIGNEQSNKEAKREVHGRGSRREGQVVGELLRVGPGVAAVVGEGDLDGERRVADGLLSVPRVAAVKVHALGDGLGGGGLVLAAGGQVCVGDALRRRRRGRWW